jgi:hypothetical protein
LQQGDHAAKCRIFRKALLKTAADRVKVSDFGFQKLMSEDLSVLASRLRSEGFDCRNLAQVGITIWEEGQGHFYPAAELRENSNLVIRRDFEAIRARRDR